VNASIRQPKAADNSDEVARTERDLRYWGAQRASARVLNPPISARKVEFGSAVTIRRGDGRQQTFRIVGIDEADPAKGTLSHLAPLAKALLGRGPGDEIKFGTNAAYIMDIE
jgi:transcription elongation GreA/GreB family factor